jgi:hypothetical protein
MLTKKFLEGKRKSFLNPIQMYAFFSFLFFLSAFYLPEPTGLSAQEEMRKGIRDGMFADSVNENEDSVRITFGVKGANLNVARKKNDTGFHFSGLEENLHQYDSAQKKCRPEDRDGWFLRTAKVKMISINERLRNKDETIISELFEGFKANLPNLVILLLPMFALILKLLYARRRFYYVEHLIFAIHLHCFAFALFSLVFLAEWLFPVFEDYSFLLYIWFLIYTLVAMKQMYRQTWMRTFLKFNFAGVSYSMFLVIGLAVNLLLSFFLVE